jgi:hypothetical protein
VHCTNIVPASRLLVDNMTTGTSFLKDAGVVFQTDGVNMMDGGF